MLDGMASALKGKNVADIQKRAQCKDQYQGIESTVKDLSWKIEKNIAEIDKLAIQIERFEEEKARTIEQIEEAVEKLASTDRART